MEIFAGLSVGLLILAALVVVTRTFALWTRTRGLPELLLSLYLCGATVLGYPLTIASSRLSAADLWPVHLAGQLVMTVGFTSLLFFTLKVFRPGASWAKGVVALCLLMLAAADVAYFMELTGPSPRPTTELIGITLMTSTPIAFAYLWTTVEALAYYGALRRRVGVGLAEPAVANRVLLWGLMTLAAGIAVAISLVAILMGVFMSAPLVTLFSCLGLVHAFCLFLAFHPPAWYRAWVERSAPAASPSA